MPKYSYQALGTKHIVECINTGYTLFQSSYKQIQKWKISTSLHVTQSCQENVITMLFGK